MVVPVIFRTTGVTSYKFLRWTQQYARRSSSSPKYPNVRFHSSSSNAVDNFLDRLEANPNKISKYWIARLKEVEKFSARLLIPKLITDTELGHDPTSGPAKAGTLLAYVQNQKKIYPEKVILTRCGDFYETYGIDAIMLINYCGLNPMGNKTKAGCPVRNIQATLDGLTSAGLSVAVYEELSDVDADRGPSAKAKLKSRAMTQIVSPATSTYVYDACLRHDEIEFRYNRPVIGLIRTASGFNLCEIQLDELVR